MSPTQKTLKFLRGLGYRAEVTEKWNQWAKIRQDLYGFIDIVGVSEKGNVIAVQCTTKGNVAARKKKVESIPEARFLTLGNVSVYVIGWGRDSKNPVIWRYIINRAEAERS